MKVSGRYSEGSSFYIYSIRISKLREMKILRIKICFDGLFSKFTIIILQLERITGTSEIGSRYIFLIFHRNVVQYSTLKTKSLLSGTK